MRENSKAAPRTTLVDRMAQARDRTVAARVERGGPAATLPPGFAHTQPMEPTRSLPAMPRAPIPQTSPVTKPGLPWIKSARPGETVTLMPGEMHFGREAAGLRTLLGSCVAITLWHPVRRIGGMCHFLLPARARRGDEPPEGKYGDEALAAMVQALLAAGTQPADYTAHLYGGADTMPETLGLKLNVGERNIEQGWSLIDRYGFQLEGVDVGEDVPRTVTLTLATGAVAMRRGTSATNPASRT